MRIRPATPADFATLQDIERSAGQAFRAIGMPEIADDAPFTVAELTRYQQAARAWVTADADDHPIASGPSPNRKSRRASAKSAAPRPPTAWTAGPASPCGAISSPAGP